MATSKACKRSPKKNVYFGDLKRGTPIVDCGHVWIAGSGKSRALVFWDGQSATKAQRLLHAAARRGSW